MPIPQEVEASTYTFGSVVTRLTRERDLPSSDNVLFHHRRSLIRVFGGYRLSNSFEKEAMKLDNDARRLRPVGRCKYED